MDSPTNKCKPLFTLHDLKACQFSSWYSTFRNLQKTPPVPAVCMGAENGEKKRTYPYNNVTIRSIIIKPLPMDFIEYLQSDGIQLPIGAENVSSFLPDLKNGSRTNCSQSNNDHDDDDCSWSSSSTKSTSSVKEEMGEEQNKCIKNKQLHQTKHHKDERFHFPQLNEKITNALKKLGPSVPKLNWSCPKDVTWINGGDLKCSTVGDVYLLLQASDFCMFDLTHALDGVEMTEEENRMNISKSHDSSIDNEIEFELVLRKWSNLHPSMEFRCFVFNDQLVAISQRHHSQHFPHLKREFMTIRSQIIDFYHQSIQYTFANNTVHNYVFDVYIDKNGRVWLIDFNIWSDRTDSLLFTWDDIMSNANKVAESNKNTNYDETYTSTVGEDKEYNKEYPEIRVVMDENQLKCDPLSSYRAPIDTVDLASGQFGTHSFQDFMAMCQRPSEHSDSEESDDER